MIAQAAHRLLCALRRCQRIAHSPHRHILLAHTMEFSGTGLLILQADIIAHILLLGGALVALVVVISEIE